MTRVLIVCDQPFARIGIKHLLDACDECEVIGVSEGSNDADREVERSHPDAIVLDLSSEKSSAQAIKSFRKASATTRIIVVCPGGNSDYAVNALDAGAAGILTRTCEPGDLRSAMRRVMNGDNYVQADIAMEIFGKLRENERRRREADNLRLTVRESQVVNCLLEGMTNRQIADRLAISEKTVKHYVGVLKGKFDASNRLEIVLAAQRLPLNESRYWSL